MRAVLDPNVIISGLLSPGGSPAKVLLAWQEGEFELIASRLLLEELERALTYPRLRRRLAAEEAEAALRWLAEDATVVEGPTEEAVVRSADPGDDYLIALAATERSALVSGDRHLLDLGAQIPVYAPCEFLDFLKVGSPRG